MKHQSLKRKINDQIIGKEAERAGEEQGAKSGSDGDGQTLALPLHGENLSAHLEHHLKALATLDGVLLETLDSKVLDAVLDFLPATAEGSDLSRLLEDGAVCRGRAVYDGFANGEQVGEGHVHAAHGDLLGRRVDVRGFVDVGDLLAAEEGSEPFGGRLLAGDKTFGAELQDSQ